MTDTDQRSPPRLTMGLPVFNGARFLPEALDSLLEQTFGDFRLVVSDNASTDATGEIAQDYAQRDSRISYVRHEQNRGAAWNFNYVVGLARTEYFKWAAADDICAPNFVERCIEVLDREPDVLCCHARTRKIDERGDVLPGMDDPTDGGLPSEWFAAGSHPCHRPDGSSLKASRRFADVLLSSGWGIRCAGVFRTAALKQSSLILPFYGSEKVMMAELALRGRFHDLAETLFFQRTHEQAASRLTSREAKAKYISGGTKLHRFQRFRQLTDYVSAIWRAPVPAWEKVKCCGWLAPYLLQFGKWPALFGVRRSKAIQSHQSPRAASLPAPTRFVASSK
jgi:glycosyltransferase involved in cell wall biosynthesis